MQAAFISSSSASALEKIINPEAKREEHYSFQWTASKTQRDKKKKKEQTFPQEWTPFSGMGKCNMRTTTTKMKQI